MENINATITPGQVGEMIALFAKKLPLTMLKGPVEKSGTAQYWINNPDKFELAITEALMSKSTATNTSAFAPVVEYTEALLKEALLKVEPVCKDWCEFHKKCFGIGMMPEELYPIIPKREEGFDRLIVIAKGLRLNRVWNVHKKRGIPTWQYWSGALEKEMQESERGPVKKTYAIWVRDAQNAIDVDEEVLKELSAKMIANQKIDTESLLERIILGLKFFDDTAEHLDVRGITLCPVSRYSDGYVPRVRRDGDCWVGVGRCSVQDSGPGLRARRVVRKQA